MLDDKHNMNFAQALIKKQFARTTFYIDNLSTTNINIRECVLQILHISDDYWMVALNIRSCTTGV